MTEEEMRKLAEDLGLEVIDLTSEHDKILASAASNPEVPLPEPLKTFYARLKAAAMDGIIDRKKANTPGFDGRGRNIAIRDLGQMVFDTYYMNPDSGPERGHNAMQILCYRLQAELYDELGIDPCKDEDPRDPVLLPWAWDGVGIWMA